MFIFGGYVGRLQKVEIKVQRIYWNKMNFMKGVTSMTNERYYFYYKFL